MTTWFVRYGATRYGGAENYLRRVVSALENSNQDVGVFSTAQYGFKTVIIPKRNKIPTWLYLRQTADLIQQSREKYQGLLFSLERLPCADIYRAGDGVHRAWMDIKYANQSKIQNHIENFKLLHKTYLNLEEATFKNSKIIIANSNRVADEIVYYYSIPRDKIRVIYNGVSIQAKNIDKQTAKDRLGQEFGFDSALPLILFVGSGFFRKGVRDFLEILSRIRLPFNAIIIGKDKHEAKYKSFAKSRNLESKVRFLGARSDVDRFYSASDVFLFPTLYEPFSNACLEAMSFGCVLYTTQQNGVSEILQDNSTIIVDNAQTSAMLGALLLDKSAMSVMQENHKKISMQYTIENNVNSTLSIIKEFS